MSTRVFITYAWESEDYRSWVRSLATRFREDGVDVRLDYWHLRDGQSVPEFMQFELEHARKVLVLCSPAYRRKNSAMEAGAVSGVGWESRIVTNSMFVKGELAKYIPVLALGSWADSAPSYLSGNEYFDLSDPKRFEFSYLALLRRITDNKEKAPPLGSLPATLGPSPVPPLRGGAPHETRGDVPSVIPARMAVLDPPRAPEPFVAHRYNLLKAPTGFIGRRTELSDLSSWVERSGADEGRVFHVVAHGGTGKSALIWHWFDRAARDQLTNQFRGRMWWSFYEPGATVANFLGAALAYSTSRPWQEYVGIPVAEQVALLLDVLHREPFLIVLDGLERILRAYAGAHPALITDENITHAEEDGVARNSTDAHADEFLRALPSIEASRVLVSTRLFPSALEGPTRQPVHRALRYDLPGLTPEDSMVLWRAFGVSGSTELLFPLFRKMDGHALVVQALAGMIANDRITPCDYEAWCTRHPHFNPFSLPLARSHVLDVALGGLSDKEMYALQVMAACATPARYPWLRSWLVGPDATKCEDADELAGVLAKLENRGLVGWDNRPEVNHYDMHPLVRGVALDRMDAKRSEHVYRALRLKFATMPDLATEGFEALSPSIELFYSYIRLDQIDDACTAYERELRTTLESMRATPQILKLLSNVFTGRLRDLAKITDFSTKFRVLGSLAVALQSSGETLHAARLLRGVCDSAAFLGRPHHLVEALNRLADVERLLGNLRVCHDCVAAAHDIASRRDWPLASAWTLLRRGQLLIVQGELVRARKDFEAALEIQASQEVADLLLLLYASLGEVAVRQRRASAAVEMLERIEHIDHGCDSQMNLIVQAHLKGRHLTAREPPNVTEAEESLRDALNRSRSCGDVHQEILALLSWADLRAQQSGKEALELLDDVLKLAAADRFPLYRAKALRLRAQVEAELGNDRTALLAAHGAYELAMCDGPPYVDQETLQHAKATLKRLQSRSTSQTLPDSAQSSPHELDRKWRPPEMGASQE